MKNTLSLIQVIALRKVQSENLIFPELQITEIWVEGKMWSTRQKCLLTFTRFTHTHQLL